MEINDIDKLNILDFSPGIKASYINENFKLLKRWIESERLRIGGWGLVEGFEFEKDLKDFTINISSGLLINEYGEEKYVKNNVFNAGPPVYKQIVEEVIVQEEGLITLKFPVYSNVQKHTIIYDPPKYNDLFNEIKITEIDTAKIISQNKISFIDENIIFISPEYEGIKVKVEYLYANDRIDGILLRKDGMKYIYELGIISTSPSQQVIEDYLKNGYYLIGFAYWHIGKTIDVEFIIKDRTYRPIYVDQNNILYINGKPYKDQNFIVFVEPEFPELYDLWYDVNNHVLFIWDYDKDGNLGWQALNDLSRSIKEIQFYQNESFPEDKMTFIFNQEQECMKFIPGHNQVEVIIDNVPLMQDQFEELYNTETEKGYLNTGYGIKLKYPLDKEAVVQIITTHSVKAKPLDDVFKRAAIFVDQGSWQFDSAVEKNTIFETTGNYEIGQNQLELYLNGKKLISGTDFKEVTKDNEIEIESRNNVLSNKFIIRIALSNGDRLEYKITRYMWSYENLSKITKDLEEKVALSVQTSKDVEDKINNLTENVSEKLIEIENNNVNMSNAIADIERDMISKTDGISLSDVKKDVAAGIKNKLINLTQQANVPVIALHGININDFIEIFHISSNGRNVLIKDVDYSLSIENSVLNCNLESEWVFDDAIIYITGIKYHGE